MASIEQKEGSQKRDGGRVGERTESKADIVGKGSGLGLSGIEQSAVNDRSRVDGTRESHTGRGRPISSQDCIDRGHSPGELSEALREAQDDSGLTQAVDEGPLTQGWLDSIGGGDRNELQ